MHCSYIAAPRYLRIQQIRIQGQIQMQTKLNTCEKVSLSICHNLWLPTQTQRGPKKKANMYMTSHKCLSLMDTFTAKATSVGIGTATDTDTDTFVVGATAVRP